MTRRRANSISPTLSVKRPGETRKAWRDRAQSPNMARSTGLVSTFSVEQALDAEKLAKGLSLCINASGSTPSIDMELLPGSRSVGWPLNSTPSMFAARYSRNSADMAASLVESAAHCLVARKTASPSPTTKGTFRVPGRSPFSCPPPYWIGTTRARGERDRT